MNFYADENFPLRTVEELRQLGHNVLTTFEDGSANQAITDERISKRAVEFNRVLITLNRKDFINLHDQNSDHAGIVICTEDPDRGGQAKRISEKVEEFEDLRGRLIRVYRPAK